MAFIDSFSHYTTDQLLGKEFGKWNGYSFVNAAGLIAPGDGPYSSAFRINISAASGATAIITRIFGDSICWTIGVRFYCSGLPTASSTIISLWDHGTIQCSLELNSAGTLYVAVNGTALGGGGSSGVVAAGAWYYIEWMVTITNSAPANTCVIRVNGTVVWTATVNVKIQNTANNTADGLSLGPGGAPSAPGLSCSYPAGSLMDYCDLYVVNGSTQAAFWGDTRVECFWPLNVGTYSQWVVGGGTPITAPGAIARDVSNDMTGLYNATVNNIASFKIEPIQTTTTIQMAQIGWMSKRMDSGARSVNLFYRSSAGTNVQQSGVNYMFDDYVYNNVVFAVEPTTNGAWTPATLNGAEYGFYVYA